MDDDWKGVFLWILIIACFKLTYFGFVETEKRCGSGFKQERTKYRWDKKWDQWEDELDFINNLRVCRDR